MTMAFMAMDSPEDICIIIGVSLEGGVGQARELAEGTTSMSLAEVVRCLE